AIKIDMSTIFVKSLESRYTMFAALDPRAFRMPISFNLRSAVNIANPNNPRQLYENGAHIDFNSITVKLLSD
ncbi:MAG: hypothetical protein AAGA02_06385, partial [Bacteroidota bacterium]